MKRLLIGILALCIFAFAGTTVSAKGTSGTPLRVGHVYECTVTASSTEPPKIDDKFILGPVGRSPHSGETFFNDPFSDEGEQRVNETREGYERDWLIPPGTIFRVVWTFSGEDPNLTWYVRHIGHIRAAKKNQHTQAVALLLGDRNNNEIFINGHCATTNSWA